MARFCNPPSLLAGVAIVSLFAAESRAQTPAVPLDRSSPPTQILIQPWATLGSPTKLDEETIRNIVRDELKRGKTDQDGPPATSGNTDHSKKKTEWFEVGRDLQ